MLCWWQIPAPVSDEAKEKKREKKREKEKRRKERLKLEKQQALESAKAAQNSCGELSGQCATSGDKWLCRQDRASHIYTLSSLPRSLPPSVSVRIKGTQDKDFSYSFSDSPSLFSTSSALPLWSFTRALLVGSEELVCYCVVTRGDAGSAHLQTTSCELYVRLLAPFAYLQEM